MTTLLQHTSFTNTEKSSCGPPLSAYFNESLSTIALMSDTTALQAWLSKWCTTHTHSGAEIFQLSLHNVMLNKHAFKCYWSWSWITKKKLHPWKELKSVALLCYGTVRHIKWASSYPWLWAVKLKIRQLRVKCLGQLRKGWLLTNSSETSHPPSRNKKANRKIHHHRRPPHSNKSLKL